MIIGTNVDLRNVEVYDAEFILKLRLDPDLNQYISKVENNLLKQEEWINNYKLRYINNLEYYFIIQNKQLESVGTIRIYNMQKDHFCWGSFIVLPQARKYATFESVILLFHYAFFDLDLHYTCFDVRKNNKKALDFHLRFGATIISENDEDIFMKFTKKEFIARKPQLPINLLARV
jgi:RimJ/RimL family protein N-acetyltransferase